MAKITIGSKSIPKFVIGKTMEHEIDREKHDWQQIDRKIRDREKIMEHEIDCENRDWEQVNCEIRDREKTIEHENDYRHSWNPTDATVGAPTGLSAKT
jgi:hypothetical protein